MHSKKTKERRRTYQDDHIRNERGSTAKFQGEESTDDGDYGSESDSDANSELDIGIDRTLQLSRGANDRLAILGSVEKLEE